MHRTVIYKSRSHNQLSLFAFLVLAVVSLVGITLWRMQSVQVMSVQSGSMTPAIKRGDAVVLRPVSHQMLAVGDVVSYRSSADQSIIITHRIVQIERNWGLVITKGDNVERADKPVPMSEIIGRVDTRIVYGGFVLNFLRSTAGLVAGVYAPAAVIVVLELRRLAAYYSKPTYRLVGYAKH